MYAPLPTDDRSESELESHITFFGEEDSNDEDIIDLFKRYPLLGKIYRRLVEKTITTAIMVNLFCFGLFLTLFLFAYYEHQTGVPSGIYYAGGIISILVWQGILLHLLHDKALLFAELVLSGAVYITFFINCGDFSGIMTSAYNIFPYLLLTGFFIYFLGPRVTLQDYNSLTDAHRRPFISFDRSPFFEFLDKTLMYSPLKRPNPKMYMVLLYTYIAYCIPFILGLHWGSATLIFPQVNITQDEMQKWGISQYIAVSVGGLLIISIIAYHAKMIVQDTPKQWKFYFLGGYLSLALYLGLVSYGASRDEYEFHFHHYFLMMLIIPFTRFDGLLSSVTQAFCLGVHLDGMVRWGMAQLWVPNPIVPTL